LRTKAVKEVAVAAAVRKLAKKAEGVTKKLEKKAVKASREVKKWLGLIHQQASGEQGG
jgi:hypothetical protein